MLTRNESKDIINFIKQEVDKRLQGLTTDFAIDLSKKVVGNIPASRVTTSDVGYYYASTNVEDAFQEVFATISGIISSGIVEDINSITGNITISGVGEVYVSVDGQTITISGTAHHTRYVDAEAITAVQASGLVLADGKCIQIEETLGTDHTIAGITINCVAGESLSFGNICYRNCGWEMQKAQADSLTTVPALYMATDTLTSGETGIFLMEGFARDDDWIWESGVLYTSSGVAGEMTAIKPTESGHQVQIIGYPESSTIIHFRPSFIVESIT